MLVVGGFGLVVRGVFEVLGYLGAFRAFGGLGGIWKRLGPRLESGGGDEEGDRQATHVTTKGCLEDAELL